MIDWLNSNDGFVLALLTFAYVVATLILVAISIYQARLTQRSITHAAEAERRRYRPHVLFDMYSEGIALYASLRNTGATPAFDIHLALSPEIFCEVRGQKRICPLIGDSVTYLAPSREIRDACAFGGEFDRHFHEPVFEGTVSYQDADKTQYTEPFRIDLRAQRQLLHVGTTDPGKELEKIAKALQDLTSSRFQPLIRIMTEDRYRSERDDMISDAQRRIEEHEGN